MQLPDHSAQKEAELADSVLHLTHRQIPYCDL